MDAKPDLFYLQLAPTALWPISSCRAPETHGQKQEDMSVRVWKCGFVANLLLRHFRILAPMPCLKTLKRYICKEYRIKVARLIRIVY